MYCKKCGSRLPDVARFCPNCGATVDGNTRKKRGVLILALALALCVVLAAAVLLTQRDEPQPNADTPSGQSETQSALSSAQQDASDDAQSDATPEQPDESEEPEKKAEERNEPEEPEQQPEESDEPEEPEKQPEEQKKPEEPEKKAEESVERLIAERVDLSDLVQTPENGVQDIRHWSEGEVRFYKKPLPMDGYTIYYLKVDRDLLESYLEMLCENGFTLVGSYDQSSYVTKSYEYALLCDGSTLPTRKGIYTKEPCHIDVWRESDGWRFEVVDGFTLCDLGLRSSGKAVTLGACGASVLAGLLQLSDTYSTDDGRLSATTLQSTILSDGEAMSIEPVLEKSSSGKYTLALTASDDEKLTVIWEKDALHAGDVFLYADIEQNDVSVRFDIDGETYQAYLLSAVKLSNLTLRVMHYDEEGDAVLYLCAEAPAFGTREVLCAVDLSAPDEAVYSSSSGSSSSGSGTYTPDYAKLDCLTCRGDGDCNTCNGYGEVRRYQGAGQTVRAKCPTCHGSGKCTRCGGTGKRN